MEEYGSSACRKTGSFFTPHKVPADRKYLVPLENIEYEYYRYNGQNRIIDQSYVVFWSKLCRRDLAAMSEGLLKKNRICAGKSLSIHGKAVWHGILELTAAFAFGNTTVWVPDGDASEN